MMSSVLRGAEGGVTSRGFFLAPAQLFHRLCCVTLGKSRHPGLSFSSVEWGSYHRPGRAGVSSGDDRCAGFRPSAGTRDVCVDSEAHWTES